MLSVWAVKTGIVANLTEALVPATADIVQLGRPVELPPISQPRRVYIGDVLNDTPQPVYQPSSQLRTESYVVPLMVDCLSMTGNAESGYATAMGLVQDIVEAIETQLANDPSWGGACHQSGLALAAEFTTVLADQPSGSGYRSGAILELHIYRKGS